MSLNNLIAFAKEKYKRFSDIKTTLPNNGSMSILWTKI